MSEACVTTQVCNAKTLPNAGGRSLLGDGSTSSLTKRLDTDNDFPT